MKIGTLLTLEIQQPETKEVKMFRCKIVEKNEQYLFIDLPIEIKTNKSTIILEGTHFSATYLEMDQSVYKFYSEIAEKVKLNVPTLAIHLPDKSNMKRIQRREYVRIETAVDVAIHGSHSPFTTVTSDISGGGMSVIIPAGMTVVEKEEADVWIVLQMDSGDYQYVSATVEVIRVKQDNTIAKTASLKFVSIAKLAQQSIIRYCFEKQREARNKELF